MSGLNWECPVCHHCIEVTGRDESARIAIRGFKKEHEHPQLMDEGVTA